MEYDKFIPGIGPDGITDMYQLKVLICYLIHVAGEPVTKAQVNEIIQTNYLANYFDFSQCFEELVKTKHLLSEEKNKTTYYTASETGSKTAKVLEIVIPSSVREKVSVAATQMLLKCKTLAKSNITTKKTDNGIMVHCACISAGNTPLELDVLVPDEDLASMIKTNFQNNPDRIYGGILSLLTGDYQSFKTLVEQD